ncbi:MAG: SdpI family protein [Pirellulales bacterium]
MKFSWRVEIVQWLILAAMFLVAAAAWSHVPDRIPIHWNLRGEVDGYGGRFAGLLLLPVVALGMYALLLIVPRFDPGYANYQTFAGAYRTIRIVILLVLAGIYGITVVVALGYRIDVSRAIGLAMAAMFVVLGNLLGKIRPNWFVGVRTPWTLSSKLSWTKTHRLAGWLFIVDGLFMALWGVLQQQWAFVLAMAVMAATTIWMVIYSYLVYRTDPDRIRPAGTSPEPR